MKNEIYLVCQNYSFRWYEMYIFCMSINCYTHEDYSNIYLEMTTIENKS